MGHSRLSEQGESRFQDAESGPDVVAVGGDHGVLAPVVGAKQLVGTIQQVETHDHDPTAEETTDPWTTFHDELGGLGDRLRDTYRKVANGDGPSEEEVKEALGVLAGAWDQVAGAVSVALKDPEVRPIPAQHRRRRLQPRRVGQRRVRRRQQPIHVRALARSQGAP